MKSINIFENLDGIFCLDLMLQNNNSYTHLIFNNICDMKIKNICMRFNWCIFIDDVSSYQMEKMKYHIKEDENDMISFYCESIDEL